MIKEVERLEHGERWFAEVFSWVFSLLGSGLSKNVLGVHVAVQISDVWGLGKGA